MRRHPKDISIICSLSRLKFIRDRVIKEGLVLDLILSDYYIVM